MKYVIHEKEKIRYKIYSFQGTVKMTQFHSHSIYNSVDLKEGWILFSSYPRSSPPLGIP